MTSAQIAALSRSLDDASGALARIHNDAIAAGVPADIACAYFIGLSVKFNQDARQQRRHAADVWELEGRPGAQTQSSPQDVRGTDAGMVVTASPAGATPAPATNSTPYNPMNAFPKGRWT